MDDLDLYERYTPDDPPLTTLVARNISTAVTCSNLTYALLATYLDLVPTAISPRTSLRVPWKISEVDAIAGLLDIEPCRFVSTSTAPIARILARRRAALVGMFSINPNPSFALMRTWLAEVYSEAYAELVLPAPSDVRTEPDVLAG